MLGAEEALHRLRGRLALERDDRQRVDDRGRHVLRSFHRGEAHEVGAVGEAALHGTRRLDGKARLADSAGAGEGEQADVLVPEALRDRRDVALAADRRVRGHGQPAPPRRRGRRAAEGGVVHEDGLLELPQLRTGLTPDRFDQGLAGLPVGRQRVRLAAAAVESEHQLRGEPLARRMLGHERPQLADELRVPPGGEVRLDALLQRRQPLLLQPRDLRLRERLELEPGQRRSAPEPERRAQMVPGLPGASALQRPPPFLELTREALRVELVRPHAQYVAGRSRHERVRLPECLAQAGHVNVHRLDRAGRRVLAPQRHREPIGADRLVGMQQQGRQDDARLDSVQRDRTGLAAHLERPEYLELHRRSR